MRSHLSAPLRVDLNLTNRCHLSCKYCYASANELFYGSNELTLQEIDKLFQEFEDMGVFRVQLAGGEPLLRRDILEIIKLTRKYTFSLTLNTTGMFLADDICVEIAKSNFELITVSLEADNKELHEKIRGGRSFDGAISAIELLKKHKIRTAVGITLNSFNIDTIFDVIDMVRPMTVDIVGIQVLCPSGRLSKNNYLIPERRKYLKFMDKLLVYKVENPYPQINLNVTNESTVFWEYYYPLQKLNKLKELKKIWGQDTRQTSDLSCAAGISVCSIGANGDVYTCEMFVNDSQMAAGNIKNESFSSIWNGSKLFETFRSIEKSSLKGACSSCKNKWCGGGCRAAAYYATGDLCGTDEHCYYSKR